MNDVVAETIAIAQNGTQGQCTVPPGYRLIGLELPALDSTTITAHLSRDGGATYRVAVDAGGTDITLAGTTTGNEFVAASDALSRLALGATNLRLVLGAAQSTAARSITALFASGGVG
jgi:hypothetical protein